MPVSVRLHRWPWSVDVPEETVDAVNDDIVFQFFGSPVLSVIKDARVLLAARYEKFIPFGSFSAGKIGINILEMPHGILSTSNSNNGEFLVQSNETLKKIIIETEGARSRTRDNSGKETRWARIVLSWSQFFDDLLEERKIEEGNATKIKWSTVLNFLKKQINDIQQPRLSLIVRIAEELHTTIPKTVDGMRRILIREEDITKD